MSTSAIDDLGVLEEAPRCVCVGVQRGQLSLTPQSPLLPNATTFCQQRHWGWGTPFKSTKPWRSARIISHAPHPIPQTGLRRVRAHDPFHPASLHLPIHGLQILKRRGGCGGVAGWGAPAEGVSGRRVPGRCPFCPTAAVARAPGPGWGAGGGPKAHVLAARLLTRPCGPAGMATAGAR